MNHSYVLLNNACKVTTHLAVRLLSSSTSQETEHFLETAGVTISTPFNGSNEQFTLLPGTYTSSSFPSLSNSSLSNSSTPSPFSSSQSTSQLSPGFSSTGSLSTSSQSFTVSTQPGLITFPSAYYEGTSTVHPLPNSTSNSSTPSEFSSLLLTAPEDSYAIVSTPGNSRIVVWDSIPDVSTLGFSGTVQKGELIEIRNTGCAGDGGECGIGGNCASNGTCVCRTGFTGNDCGTSCLLSICVLQRDADRKSLYEVQVIVYPGCMGKTAPNSAEQDVRIATMESLVQVYASIHLPTRT